MADKELQTLKIITRDPKKYLLVNLEDGTFFQGQDKEEPIFDDEVIRRRATLMWQRPQNIESLLRALDVILDGAIETAGEDRGTTNT